MCNKMYRALHEIYEDHYGDCSKSNICLVDLLGEERILEMCEHCGLSIEYPEEYAKLKESK